jgi:hypothetical protein
VRVSPPWSQVHCRAGESEPVILGGGGFTAAVTQREGEGGPQRITSGTTGRPAPESMTGVVHALEHGVAHALPGREGDPVCWLRIENAAAFIAPTYERAIKHSTSPCR